MMSNYSEIMSEAVASLEHARQLLADEIAGGIHALALEIRSDSEPDPRAARVAD